MNVRKVEVLELAGKIKKMTLEGEIHQAQNEIFRAKLCPGERNKIMNIFVDSIMDYNESIDWRKLESSFSFAKILTGGRI